MTTFYFDVHVPRAICDQLRRRHVEVLTAQDDQTTRLTDENLLERSTALGRVLFTQDIRFKALAEQWQREGIEFGGLIFGHQLGATIGQFVSDLELIAKSTNPEEWKNAVEHLPL